MRKYLLVFFIVFLFILSGCEFLGNDTDNDLDDDIEQTDPNGEDPADDDPADDDPADDDPADDDPADDDPADDDPADDDPVMITVSFETNGGSLIDDASVEENTALTNIEDPIRSGYSFEGWFIDSELTTAFDSDMLIIEPLTLYAKWALDLTGRIPIEAIYTLENETEVIIEGIITAVDFQSFIVMDETGYAQVYGYYEDIVDVGHRVRVQGVLDDDGYIPMIFLDESKADPFEVLEMNVEFTHEPQEITIQDLAKLTIDDALPVGYYRIVGLLANEPIGYARFMVEVSDDFLFIETSWQGYELFEDSVGNILDITGYITRFRVMDPYLKTGHYVVHYYTSDDFVSHEPDEDEAITILTDFIERTLNRTILRYSLNKQLPIDPYEYDIDVSYALKAQDDANANITLVDGIPYIEILNNQLDSITLEVTLTKNMIQETFDINVAIEPIIVTSIDDFLVAKDSEMHHIHGIMLGHIFGGQGLVMDANTGSIMIIETPKFNGLPPQFSEFYAYGSYRTDGLNDIFYVEEIEGVVTENDTLQHSLSPVMLTPFTLYDDVLYEEFLYVHLEGYFKTGPETFGYPGLFSLNEDYFVSVLASWDQVNDFYEYNFNTRMIISGFLITLNNDNDEEEIYIVFEDFVQVFDDE